MNSHATCRPACSTRRPRVHGSARRPEPSCVRAGEESCKPHFQDASKKLKPHFQCSQQFSIVALTNASGAITERYAYSAYGKPVFCNASGTEISQSDEDNRVLYTGREWDEELKLYYFRARLYDAGVGRFLGRDVLGAKLLNGQTCSAFSQYSLASVDPSGNSGFVPDPNGPIDIPTYDCQEFLGILPRLGEHPSFPQEYKRKFNRLNPHVYCGNCGGGAGQTFPGTEGCEICLESHTEGRVYEDYWLGLLIAGLEKCEFQVNSGRCKIRTEPNFNSAPPEVIPEPMPWKNCKECRDQNIIAIQSQCRYFFPVAQMDRSRVVCIESLLCETCKGPCPERWKNGCPKFPDWPWVPQ